MFRKMAISFFLCFSLLVTACTTAQQSQQLQLIYHIPDSIVAFDIQSSSTENLMDIGYRLLPPPLSPDGSRLGFVSQPSDEFQVYMMDFPNGEPTLIFEDDGLMPRIISWSANSERFLFLTEPDVLNYEVRVSDDPQQVIEGISLPDTRMSWSPDEQYITYIGGSIQELNISIALYNIDTQENYLIEIEEEAIVVNTLAPVSWASDSKRLLIGLYNRDTETYGIGQFDVDTLEVNSIHWLECDCTLQTIALSPNDNYILFADANRNGYRLSLYDMETGDIQIITTSENLIDLNFAWSPDENYFAFSTRREETYGIYIYDMANESIEEITAQSGANPTSVMGWRVIDED